jgi:hypothetical protein
VSYELPGGSLPGVILRVLPGRCSVVGNFEEEGGAEYLFNAGTTGDEHVNVGASVTFLHYREPIEPLVVGEPLRLRAPGVEFVQPVKKASRQVS